MIEAALLGLVAASSLMLGALLSFGDRLSDHGLGLVMAFGSGVLLSAVAYELVAEALQGGPWGPALALAFGAGAVAFYVGSLQLDRITRAGPGRRGRPGPASGTPSARSKGSAIVLGAVLDGIPESVVLGVSLIGGGAFSLPILLSVFISNVPEALAASSDLRRGGLTEGRILVLWSLVALASAGAAALGYAALSQAPEHWVAAVQMFAGGAIIAMLAESMVPEAYEKGGRAVGLATALGFALAAILSSAT